MNNMKVEIKDLADKVRSTRDKVSSKEHTKMAYILPFIKSLGYDVFNTIEVVPEYSCSKDKKVDYALCVDLKPYIIMMCKDCGKRFNKLDISRLMDYFSASSAKIAVLTNGIEYLFFTNNSEESSNFTHYSFNVLNFSEEDILFLTKLSKENIETSDISVQSKLQSFKRDFEYWLISHNKSFLDKFVKYMRGSEGTFDLSDSDMQSIVSDVLFGYVAEGIPPKDNSNVVVRPSTGVTDVIPLSDDDFRSKVTGSHLVEVRVADKVYNCDKFYLMYDILLDYCFDNLGMSENDINNLVLVGKRGRVKKVFFKEKPSVTGVNTRYHRGFFYSSSVPAHYVVEHMRKFCDVLGIDKSSFYISLVSKEDYNSFNS